MSMSDPLADMLTRIRNANMVRHESVEIPNSNLKTHVAENLKKEGYINGLEVIEDSKQGILKISLKYDRNNNRVITGLKRVSKPGCRVYVQSNNIPKVMSGLGVAILSTSKGVLTDKEARQQGVGGEVLCEVW
ncbi:MAG: 30S ribosomal protein S8 [Desulfobulbaceae bacterium]|nr:MAG: 30S ribosomal protein S8 [Desulfobulbaceae bacterium]